MPRPRSDIRKRILSAARERFLYEGVDGASLRRIATEAHTSIGMVYYYFPEKDDLLLAVVEDVYAALMEELETLLDPTGPLAVSMQRASQRVGRMSHEESMVVRIVVREMLVSNTRRMKLVERFSRGHLALVLKLVGAAIARGEIRADVPPLVAMLALGGGTIIPQFVARTLFAEGPAPGFALPAPEALAGGLVDAVLRGLGPAQTLHTAAPNTQTPPPARQQVEARSVSPKRVRRGR